MVEFSIPGNDSLNVGFGDSGTQPRKFYLRENQTVDVGFLKLYLSTQCVDFSGVVQKSPFVPQERAEKEVQRERKETWDAILIPVIQRKGTLSMGNLSLG